MWTSTRAEELLHELCRPRATQLYNFYRTMAKDLQYKLPYDARVHVRNYSAIIQTIVNNVWIPVRDVAYNGNVALGE